jgi:hypothetical protein
MSPPHDEDAEFSEEIDPVQPGAVRNTAAPK